MISISKSPTADTRTCDVTKVERQQLLDSSRQHITDVAKAMAFFSSKLFAAAAEHDYDKLTDIDWFYEDFQTNFEQTGWWDNHRKIHRHHLAQKDGVPEDVNLLDVLEYIADCVMAGMARSGEVYPLVMDDELLVTASMAEVGRARFRFEQGIERKSDGVRIATADVGAAILNSNNYKPARIPAWMKAELMGVEE